MPGTEKTSLLLLVNVQVALILISAFVIPLVDHLFLIQSRAFAQSVAPVDVLRSTSVYPLAIQDAVEDVICGNVWVGTAGIVTHS